MKAAIKAGRLANGFERGKGKIVHAVDSLSPMYEYSICGTKPAVQWIEKDETITCKKCLKLLKKSHFGKGPCMRVKVTIELELDVEYGSIKADVYQYLKDLMEDETLYFETEELLPEEC